MTISSISLQHIRSHTSIYLELSKKVTIISGDNAAGKTTLIEAIVLLSTGESFRADKIEEVLQFKSQLGRIKGVLEDVLDSESGVDELELIITPGQVQGKKTAKRIFSVNGIKRRKKDAVGKFYAVVFRPEDMRLIEGSPGRRRQFIDSVLQNLYSDYDYSLAQYESGLKRRNKLLSLIKDRKQSSSTLSFWDATILKHGQIIQEYRRRFLSTFSSVSFPIDFSIGYVPSVMSKDRMENYKEKEIAAGHTLIGPHKDDFEVLLLMDGERRNVAIYGSRGQQRLGVLWLKLCELSYAKSALGESPLLLLDDILSELDDKSQKLALQNAFELQTVITSADKGVIEKLSKIFKDSSHYNLEKNKNAKTN